MMSFGELRNQIAVDTVFVVEGNREASEEAERKVWFLSIRPPRHCRHRRSIRKERAIFHVELRYLNSCIMDEALDDPPHGVTTLLQSHHVGHLFGSVDPGLDLPYRNLNLLLHIIILDDHPNSVNVRLPESHPLAHLLDPINPNLKSLYHASNLLLVVVLIDAEDTVPEYTALVLKHVDLDCDGTPSSRFPDPQGTNVADILF